MDKFIPGLIMLFVTITGCGYAAVRGGPPERWAAGMFIANVVLSDVSLYLSRRHRLTVEPALMAVDIALMFVLVVLALRAQRFWPIWAAALQVDAVLTHFLMFSRATPPFSYAFALWLWALPIPLIIGVGAWRHRRRLKLWGEDPAWT